MNAKKLLALWGLKWNPFSPELPSEGLLMTPRIDHFAWRIEQLVQEGGLRADLGGVWYREVRGAADCRRPAFRAARCRDRRDREAPVEEL